MRRVIRPRVVRLRVAMQTCRMPSPTIGGTKCVSSTQSPLLSLLLVSSRGSANSVAGA
ncbi:hypothetical protein QJS10_CPB17g00015 [Acorus calamus]|uniref:Uncharacterized protein n=1 Tax=Acorus calamus TaxID=4465 RepID=A0AAV9CT41_ACOCL|nr:hypothetical protein QJS10_CPB17g00015 [Acorus calamus]